MNVLFLSLGEFGNVKNGSVHIDLVKYFVQNGHEVYVACKNEKRNGQKTTITTEEGIHILRVLTGNIKRIGLIEKGISTLLLEKQFFDAIKKYYFNVKFDLVLYHTPPITFTRSIAYIKKRDGSKSYLLLKDIFPQNAVDLGMLKKNGIKSIIYRYFRRVEKKLYKLSDYIGCMSPANVDYLLMNNPEIHSNKVEVCPNSLFVKDLSVTKDVKINLRQKYGIPIDKKVFIYGGNLGKPQGIDHVIRCLIACENIHNAFFLIIGSGTEYHALEEYVVRNHPNNVLLLKSVPKDEYEEMIGCCDIGLIFLDFRFTIPNYPSRLLSYMQAKLPVIACTDINTDIGKTIVEGKFGWWCPSNDAEQFKRTVQTAVNDDISVAGENAFDYIRKHFSVDISYETIINRIIG